MKGTYMDIKTENKIGMVASLAKIILMKNPTHKYNYIFFVFWFYTLAGK